ncbi:MAG: hypothetical protein L3J91_06250, partial [Thermoplasmata archaeon]|nr:hypothetical protein [Thermoplasmata archaeon]
GVAAGGLAPRPAVEEGGRLPWEMLSGPDLGGGFLFQLTVERSGERARMIYHAQEGGIDASGPPRGSPVPFGFELTDTACAIGGRDCYHRVFDVGADGVPAARMAYNRLRFVTAPMLAQQYGGAEVPLRAALSELQRRFASVGLRDWFVAGPAAAWLQGAALQPLEIDLGVDRAGVASVAAALHELLIEPVGETVWREVGPVYGARAYVGTLVSGVRVRWGLRPDGAVPHGSDLAAGPGEIATRTVPFETATIRVSRSEHGLVRAAVARNREEANAIAAVLRGEGPDDALLVRLLAESGLPPPEQARVRATVGPSTGP